MNLHIVCGNLGKEPETRQAGETAITTFSVATKRRTKKDGQWSDVTDWHNITAFGKTAEACAKFLSKGSRVLVRGASVTEKWTDKQGQDRYTTKILADDVEFLSPAQGGNDRQDDDRNDDRGRSGGRQDDRRGGRGDDRGQPPKGKARPPFDDEVPF